jgi:hypothetical protein
MEEIFTGMNNGDKLAEIVEESAAAKAVDDSKRVDFETELQGVLETNQTLAMQYCQMMGMFSLPLEELNQQLEEAFGLAPAATPEEALAAFKKSPQMSFMFAGLRKLNGILDKAFDIMAEHPTADKHRTAADTTDEVLLGIAVARGLTYVQIMPEEAREMMMEMMGPIVEPYKLK